MLFRKATKMQEKSFACNKRKNVPLFVCLSCFKNIFVLAWLIYQLRTSRLESATMRICVHLETNWDFFGVNARPLKLASTSGSLKRRGGIQVAQASSYARGSWGAKTWIRSISAAETTEACACITWPRPNRRVQEVHTFYDSTLYRKARMRACGCCLATRPSSWSTKPAAHIFRV